MATPTNLPSSFTSGDVLTAAQMNNLRGAFRILQVASFETATLATNSTTTFAASGLTISITPQATSSKILIFSVSSIAKTAGNVSNAVNLRMRRGSTVLTSQTAVLFTGTGLIQVGTSPMIFLDSPNTTSAVTYDVQFANFVAAAQVEHNANGSASTIVVMEVSA
jgi:hypothetical protein